MVSKKAMSPVEALKACALFNGFGETGLKIMAGITTQRTFPNGAPLFVENMMGESMFLLVDGKVRLSVRSSAGAETALGELAAGDFLGELCLLGPSQRLCTATAVSNLSALEIRQADFQKLMGQKPQACIKLLMAIVSQFGRKVQENRELFKALLPKGS